MAYYEDDYYEGVEEDVEPISEKATDTIIAELPPSIVDAIVNSAAQALANRLERAVMKRAEELAQEAWSENLSAAMQSKASDVLENIMNLPRQQTNEYGEPIGSPQTFTEKILKEWKSYLSNKVDSNGSDSRYGDTPRIEWMIKAFAMKHIEEASKQAIAGVTSEAKKRVQEAVSRYIAEQLSPRVDIKALSS